MALKRIRIFMIKLTLTLNIPICPFSLTFTMTKSQFNESNHIIGMVYFGT